MSRYLFKRKFINRFPFLPSDIIFQLTQSILNDNVWHDIRNILASNVTLNCCSKLNLLLLPYTTLDYQSSSSPQQQNGWVLGLGIGDVGGSTLKNGRRGHHLNEFCCSNLPLPAPYLPLALLPFGLLLLLVRLGVE